MIEMFSIEDRIKNLESRLEELENKRFPSAADEHLMIQIEDELFELRKEKEKVCPT